jgi:hypothetical protein
MASVKRTTLTKLRLMYIPFLIIAVSFITLYTFLDWLLLMKLELDIKEEIAKV